MKLISLIITVLLLFITSQAKAELVGMYDYYIDEDIMLQISLSDTQRAEIENGLSACQKKGMWRVLIEATNKINYPKMLQYAYGCWHAEDNKVLIDATTIEKSLHLNLSYPQSSFKLSKENFDWSKFKKRKPTTENEEKKRAIAEIHKQEDYKNNKEHSDLIKRIEYSIQCAYAPFPHLIIDQLNSNGYLQAVTTGRAPVYKVTKELIVFNKKLLFVSGGGEDGRTEDFLRKPKIDESYIPTHFSITLESMPSLDAISIHKESVPPYKSDMQFITHNSYDKNNTGVTISCGYNSF